MTLGVEHLTTHEKVLGLVAHGDTTLVDMMEEMEGTETEGGTSSWDLEEEDVIYKQLRSIET